MKRLILLISLCSALLAQTPQTVTVTVSGAKTIKTWSITLVPLTTISDFSCDKSAMAPGDTTICTITLSQGAPTAIPVAITVPDGFTGPASITFPVGMTAQSFQLARTQLIAAIGPQVMASGYTVWTAGAFDYHVLLSIPCCALVDQCGLASGQVSQFPCG